jgi:hypothetical protein
MAVTRPRLSPSTKDSNVSGMVKISPAQKSGASESSHQLKPGGTGVLSSKLK